MFFISVRPIRRAIIHSVIREWEEFTKGTTLSSLSEKGKNFRDFLLKSVVWQLLSIYRHVSLSFLPLDQPECITGIIISNYDGLTDRSGEPVL